MDAIAFYEEGDELTCLVNTTAVIGGRFVKIVADRDAGSNLIQVAPAGAGDKAFGVAVFDSAVGQRVTIKSITSGNVMPVTNSAVALAAGDSVKSGAAGVAAKSTAGDNSYGVAVTSCAANQTAQIALGRHVA